MVKEERDEKSKQDIDKEYPKWAWVDCKFQNANFFKDVKELSTKRLDPKHDLIDEHVIITNIAKVFGNVKTFKCNNLLLTKEA